MSHTAGSRDALALGILSSVWQQRLHAARSHALASRGARSLSPTSSREEDLESYVEQLQEMLHALAYRMEAHSYLTEVALDHLMGPEGDKDPAQGR